MKIDLFHKKIIEVVERYHLNSISDLNCNMLTFLKFFNVIFKDENPTLKMIPLKMTHMTILFESFFRSLADNSILKKDLANTRSERWGNHYGTPTLTFVLTYNAQIEQTKLLFDLASSTFKSLLKPWEHYPKYFAIDKQNNLVVDEQSIEKIAMPVENEKKGQLLKTYNPSGGFTTIPCDPVSKKFIEFAANGKTVLEIGAAFGAASLQALSKKAIVFSNDIDARNLAVIKNRYLKKSKDYRHSVTGDEANLILIPGAFPDELSGLPKNFFDAILISRVLHFFKGEKIEQSLRQLFTHMKPGGKLFIVCETPFLKNWQRFMPEYEKRVKAGATWPGEISNPADFESSGRAASLPMFVHWITKDILEKSIIQSNFEVEYLSYIDRHDQFPTDLLFDGKESVGAIAVKPYLT